MTLRWYHAAYLGNFYPAPIAIGNHDAAHDIIIARRGKNPAILAAPGKLYNT